MPNLPGHNSTVQSPRLKRDNKIHVSVFFHKKFLVSKTIESVAFMSKPNVLLWYIGCYGWKKNSAHFYRDSIIDPLISKNNKTQFWLVDLTAWGAFKYPQGNLKSESSCCKKIEEITDEIKCIRSSEIFNHMTILSDEEAVLYFKHALQRPFLRKISSSFLPLGITVKEVIDETNDSGSILYTLRDLDVSHAYSIFQYLEGCLLVHKIVSLKSKTLKFPQKLEIVFILPNNEIKYYRDESNSFKSDVSFLLNKLLQPRSDLYIEINFFSFAFGKNELHRPYNYPGTTIKSTTFSAHDVVSIDQLKLLKQGESNVSDWKC